MLTRVETLPLSPPPHTPAHTSVPCLHHACLVGLTPPPHTPAHATVPRLHHARLVDLTLPLGIRAMLQVIRGGALEGKERGGGGGRRLMWLLILLILGFWCVHI